LPKIELVSWFFYLKRPKVTSIQEMFLILSQEILRSLVENSKVFERQRGKPTYESEIPGAVEKLTYIASRVADKLVNVFKLNSEQSNEDIELPILRAFIEGNKRSKI
jgi:hypothetical protein